MQTNYEVEIDPEVFNTAYLPFLHEMARTQIYYGGPSSGKSVFLAQRCVYDLMAGGRNYLVCRQVARTLKTSVFAQVSRIIAEWGVGGLFNVNKSDFTITCSNGYQAVFVGLDDTEKIKSIVPLTGAWTDVWVEEATETDRQAVKQLYKRQRGGREDTPKRLTLSFNPILQSHWIYDEYFTPAAWTDDQTEYHGADVSILKTWYIHNRFLTPDDIHDLENEKDKYFYQVYTLGNWGILGNVIFTNWRVEDLSGMRDQFTNHHNGLDFGFADDPAAMPATHYDRKNKTIYLYEELYEYGLTNDLLAAAVKNIIESQRVTCDSAEPKSIKELRNHGVNAHPAKKGKDSVLFGIQWLQQQQIVIDPRCINTINEFRQYKWKEDASGRAIPEPVDRNNHSIDGLRYGYEEESFAQRGAETVPNPFY